MFCDRLCSRRSRIIQDAGEFIKSKILVNEDGCWVWQGSIDAYGYARCNKRLGGTYVHRISLKVFKGIRIELGDRTLETDHICKNRSCVNPEHLRIVTVKENRANRSKAGTPARTDKARLYTRRWYLRHRAEKLAKQKAARSQKREQRIQAVNA